MSSNSPSANGRDQQGPDVTDREPHPPVHDESGFSSGVDGGDDVPPGIDIETTEDPAKD